MAEDREALERELRVRLKKLSPSLQRIIVSKLNMGSTRIGDTAMLADLRDRCLWLAMRGGHKEAEEVITIYDELWRLMHNQPKPPESKGNKLRRRYG